MMKKIFALVLAVMMLLSASALAEDFTLEAIDGMEFGFSSGVGAWGTWLVFDKDGHFTGDFHDSEMGETGDGYPNGTVYTCAFNGQLEIAEKVDDFTYTLKVVNMQFDEGQEPESIEDGIRYVLAAPYGLENAETLTLYLPGKPVSELDETFLSWAHLEELDEMPETLPWYGIYSEADESGFIGMA